MPLPPPESRSLQAVGARRRAPPEPAVAAMVQTLRRLSAEGGGLVGLFDARAVATERQLLSAWAHLGRSRSRGESRLRDRGAELALYLAGDDQLPRALQRVGISDSTESFVVVAEKPRAVETLLTAFGLEVDPSAFPRPVDAAILARLGVPDAERDAVPAAAWEGLLLERVAFVDLSPARADPSAVDPKKR